MTTTKSSRTDRQARDVSGYRIFSAGELGAAHEMAHQMLDQGRPEAGHRWLGQWLEGRTGEGSKWVHLQWHMLVFEVAVGAWDSARARFRTHIAPAARNTNEALTDAPSALWRLALSAEQPVELPWNLAREAALRCLGGDCTRFVVLHHLLALAGAGDVASIDRWLVSARVRDAADKALRDAGLALRKVALRHWSSAARALEAVIPRLGLIGGSHAQNQLFAAIRDHAVRSSAANDNRAIRALRIAG
jgi:hypothetical protein